MKVVRKFVFENGGGVSCACCHDDWIEGGDVAYLTDTDEIICMICGSKIEEAQNEADTEEGQGHSEEARPDAG